MSFVFVEFSSSIAPEWTSIDQWPDLPVGAFVLRQSGTVAVRGYSQTKYLVRPALQL